MSEIKLYSLGGAACQPSAGAHTPPPATAGWYLEFKEVFHSMLEFDKQYLFYIHLSWSGVS